MNGFKHLYMCEWCNEIEIEELTIDEAVEKYNIDRESVGYDNGIFFSKIAIRIDNWGRYRVVTYLQENAISHKKFDFYILIKTKDKQWTREYIC